MAERYKNARHGGGTGQYGASARGVCELHAGLSHYSEGHGKVRSGHANADAGFQWRVGSGGKLCIFRGLRCVYRLQIRPETDRHRVFFYIHDGIDSLEDTFKNMPPRETLVQLLIQWMGHEAVLKAVDLHCHIVPASMTAHGT